LQQTDGAEGRNGQLCEICMSLSVLLLGLMKETPNKWWKMTTFNELLIFLLFSFFSIF